MTLSFLETPRRHAAWFLLVALLATGCARSLSDSTAPDPSSKTAPVTSSVVVQFEGIPSKQDLPEQMLAIEKGLGRPLTLEEKSAILQDVDARLSASRTNVHAKPVAPLAAAQIVEYLAYGWRWLYSGRTDLDVGLEYAWEAGGIRRGYGFLVYDYVMYQIIQLKYGGRLASWTWMEGSKQRVTAMVGAALWVPFNSPGFYSLRTAIRARVTF